ncbi:MAG: cupredoxin domain-containing protein [bacterium]|nr:cupredoxin domain-containing protein [bacterium]
MRIERVTVVIGSALMAIVLVASLVRAGQKLAAGGFAPAIAPSASAASATIGSDGVQHIALSFGDFNYTPDTIRVKRDVPVEIAADTQKLSGCFSTFVIPELNIWKQFTPTDAKLAFTPKRAGTFKFSCAMGMGAGRLIVEG